MADPLLRLDATSVSVQPRWRLRSEALMRRWAGGGATPPRLARSRGARGLAATDAAVLPLDGELFDAARSVAAGLRAAGLRTTLALEQRKLGKELTRVGRAGALVAVLVGPEDWARGEVTVRDLGTREQVTVLVADAAEAAARIVRGQR